MLLRSLRTQQFNRSHSPKRSPKYSRNNNLSIYVPVGQGNSPVSGAQIGHLFLAECRAIRFSSAALGRKYSGSRFQRSSRRPFS